MKKFKSKKHILRYPLTIILISFIALKLITIFSWYAIYSPSSEEVYLRNDKLKRNVSKLDHGLQKHKKNIKELYVATMMTKSISISSEKNKNSLQLLEYISKLNDMRKNHFSVLEKSDKSIQISIEPKNTAKFHSLIEAIESQKYIDRMTLIKNENKYTLTLYIRHMQENEL